MTYCSALERTDDAAGAQSGLDEIASVWAVLATLEELPVSSDRKHSLVATRQLFLQRLEAAGICEAELAEFLEHSNEHVTRPFGRPRPPTLRVVRE